MKYIYAILIALAMPCLISAQSDITNNYALKGAKKVSLDFQYGDLIIEQYDGSEVELTGQVTVNGEPAASSFIVTEDRSSGTLMISAEADFSAFDKQLTIVMNDGRKIFKRGDNISIESVSDEEGVDKVYHGVDVDANFKVRLPRNIDLKIESTYGSITVKDYWEKMNLHSTYGSVDVVLNNPPAAPVFRVSSTYSEVDLTIPETVNADLRLTTDYGQIFTDMDIKPDFKTKGKNSHHGQDISAKLNKGEGSIKLDATYSNIYLRKSL